MKEISPYEFDFNAFKSFGKDWALVVVEDDKEDNAMTIAWGQIGILWSIPVLTVYIRNNRYTKHMMDEAKTFSCCFFNESYKKELSLCGTKSRKELDKISACNFTRIKDNGTLYLKEAKITFILKKLYSIDLSITSDIDIDIKKHYKEGECHSEYISQIEKIIIND